MVGELRLGVIAYEPSAYLEHSQAKGAIPNCCSGNILIWRPHVAWPALGIIRI